MSATHHAITSGAALLAVPLRGIDGIKGVIEILNRRNNAPFTEEDRALLEAIAEEVAKAYLEYLYSDEGQEIIGRNFYRPTNPTVAAKYESTFPKLQLITIDEVFGGWSKAQKTHFADGAAATGATCVSCDPGTAAVGGTAACTACSSGTASRSVKAANGCRWQTAHACAWSRSSTCRLYAVTAASRARCSSPSRCCCN